MPSDPEQPGFFHELKRRRVIRVAVVYALVGLGVAEAADVVLPRLQLPDWSVTLVVALLLLGFPVAVGLSWAFDVESGGVRPTPFASGRSALTRTNVVEVIPLTTTLRVEERFRGDPEAAAGDDLVQTLARETGARYGVTGTYYREPRGIRLQTRLVDGDHLPPRACPGPTRLSSRSAARRASARSWRRPGVSRSG